MTTCHAACSGLSLEEALPDGVWWIVRDTGDGKDQWKCVLTATTTSTTTPTR